jgi:UDP-N-acetylmuramoylalanine--D-glutamate ligase
LEQTDSTTPVVLELSSWQLSDLCGRKLLKPKVSVITLIVPDHQNWYHSMEKYVADKKLIYADQDKTDYTLCNASDDWGKIFAKETKAKVIFYDNKNLPENLLVPGKHMQQNVKTACLAVAAFSENKYTYEQVLKVMKTFPGIEHRLEFFYEWKCNDITYRFFNDSAATVPEAASAALEAFTEPVHLITGGTDKLCDFTPLALNLSKAKTVRTLAGTGTDNLNKVLQQHNFSIPPEFESLETLLKNLKHQFENTKTEKNNRIQIVLFSPGATSFGMFKNEFDRGTTFKTSVKQIFV